MNDVERRIRAARPLSGHRDLPLSDRAKRELTELLVSTTPHAARERATPRPSSRRRLLLAAAIVVAIVSLVSSATVLMPARTWAATPPLLPVTPISGTASELLNRLADVAEDSADPAPTGDIHIAFQEWALNMVEDPETGGVVAEATVAVPQRIVIDRYPDGSLTSVITAGRTLGDSENAAPAADMPPEGTVLSRDVYGPGEYQSIFPGLFPTDQSEIAPFAAPYFGPEIPPDANRMVSDLIPSLLTDQVLDGAQRSALFHYLASLPGIELVGSVTDRLGRPGTMFATRSADDPDWTNYLVVATETGRILATETHYSGHDRPDLRSPSVTSYTAWEIGKETP